MKDYYRVSVLENEGPCKCVCRGRGFSYGINKNNNNKRRLRCQFNYFNFVLIKAFVFECIWYIFQSLCFVSARLISGENIAHWCQTSYIHQLDYSVYSYLIIFLSILYMFVCVCLCDVKNRGPHGRLACIVAKFATDCYCHYYLKKKHAGKHWILIYAINQTIYRPICRTEKLLHSLIIIIRFRCVYWCNY